MSEIKINIQHKGIDIAYDEDTNKWFVEGRTKYPSLKAAIKAIDDKLGERKEVTPVGLITLNHLEESQHYGVLVAVTRNGYWIKNSSQKYEYFEPSAYDTISVIPVNKTSTPILKDIEELRMERAQSNNLYHEKVGALRKELPLLKDLLIKLRNEAYGSPDEGGKA